MDIKWLLLRRSGSQERLEENVKAQRKTRSQFTLICRILLLLGIDLESRTRCRTVKIYLWIIAKLSIILFCYNCVIMLNFISQSMNTTAEGLKVIVSKSIFYLGGQILWFYMWKSKGKISCLIQTMLTQENAYQLHLSNSFDIFSVSMVVVMQSLFYLPNIYPNSEVKYKSYIRSLFLGFVDTDDGSFYSFYIVITFLYTSLTKTFVISVLLLYVVFCKHIQKALLKYVATNEEICLSAKYCNTTVISRFRCYNSLLRSAKSFQSAMSVPVSIVFSYKVVETFYGLLILMKEFHKENPLNMFVYLVQGFISFSLVSLSAASVNEADAIAKASNDNLVQSAFSISNFHELDLKINFLHENNKPAFTLTACGFLEFKKTLFMSAVGCFFTYALLIINLGELDV